MNGVLPDISRFINVSNNKIIIIDNALFHEQMVIKVYSAVTINNYPPDGLDHDDM